ncbi:YdeI/OmpD-associated family protein [Herbiconiux daphne]|uniref:YdeI/OmpD-associated family protein n=1 Tax=Herbiconiux daphne TaxID=2970914 RepID=A0ABT2GYE1_9MICO|nr:YdeI/OmpD-associated family protein [Herbiconiux daphne]MCS5732984.1 YdeI/OmpD-associated family protein [Herbiconiux daphne]
MVDYRDPGAVEFDAVIVRNTDVANASAWVIFPFSVPELFGVKGRVPVAATIDGEPYRGSLMKMGGDEHMLVLLKEIRARIGKEAGDRVHVVLRVDEAPRVVELGADARAALAESGQAEAFEALSYSHQREYQQWIDGAKRPDTRAARIARLPAMVAERKRVK